MNAPALPAFGLRHRLDMIWEFALSSFQIMLAHRVRYVVGVLNYLTYAAVYYYLWQALYTDVGIDTQIHGYTFKQMATYVCVGWIMRSAYFSNSDNILAARINKGEIASDLMRPVSLFVQFYGAALGEALFRLFFMAAPILGIVLFVFDISAPPSVLHWVYFLYSATLAFHLFFAINFMTGLVAAWTEKLQAFLWAKFMLIQFLSGLLLPIGFLPVWLRGTFDILPFKGMQYVPMEVYLGNISGERLRNELLLQTAWTVALLFASTFMWARVRRRLETTGG
jgi:ABC-2 type transport system permease protein